MKYPVFCFLALLMMASCRQRADSVIQLSGKAQGTTYSISWISKTGNRHQASIDSIFRKIDSSLSTYLPASLISRINRNDSTAFPDEHFIFVFNKARDISEKTGGAFDITVGPLVNAWGFGFSKKENVDSAYIRELLLLTGYKKVKLEKERLHKEKKEILLDLNAIAQGYTVDVLSAFLESQGIENYFVELGGEVKAKGKKNNDQYWKVGIDKPMEDGSGERALQAILELENKSLATSGNYRKFYEENGQKYSHIIDPFTGYPARNNLLSVSVIASDCITADAYATAFMVMGLERSKNFLTQRADLNLEVYFIYDEQGKWKTFISESLKKRMKELP